MGWIAFLSNKQRELMTSELLEAHVKYLKKIWSTGELKLCGPLVDGSAIMVFNVDTEQQARLLVGDDPFSEVKYYREVRFEQFMEANLDNNFLLDEALDIMSSAEYQADMEKLKLG